MIKRTISILIIVVMMFSLTAYAQSRSAEILSGMDLLPRELADLMSEKVTRAQFAAVAAAVAGLGIHEADFIPYSDVSNDNQYSGAIALVTKAGYMSGVGADSFAPDEPVTGQQALAAFIRILGYESAAVSVGGWPDGYMRLSQRMGFFKALTSSVTEPITFSELWNLCDLVLEAPTADTGYFTDGGEILENLRISEENGEYMNSALDVYRYEGKVTSIDDTNHSCIIYITENVIGSPHKVGENVRFNVSSSINILEFDKAPVEIYADGEGRVLSINYKEGCAYKYGVISSVNGDERDNIKYNPSLVSEIMLLDDEKRYKISDEEFAIYLNGNKVTASIDLKGRYAKVITDGGKIISLEIWDIKEGGLITTSDYKQIVFLKGNSTERINDVEGYDRRMVIINGEYRDITELKTDAIFDYYIDKDKTSLIIFASEKKISDVYKSISADSVEIGNLWLLSAPTIYASTDGIRYDDNKLSDLLNCNVTAYIDSMERVRYVRSESGEIRDNEFIGYLMGFEDGGKLGSDKAALVNLENGSFEEKIYTVSEKIRFEGSLTNGSVYSSAGADDGTAVYKFKTNGGDEIISVAKAEAFHGFADANGDAMVKGNSIGSFPQSAHPFMWVGGKKLYFDFDTNIVAMYEKSGDMVFKKCTWNELSGKLCSDENIIVRFFGREMSSDVDLIFMSGPLDTIVPSENTYGIITQISNTLNADGETAKRLTVNNEYSYTINNTDAAGLETNTFIYYSTVVPFGSNEISIISSLSLDGDMDSWKGNSNGEFTVYEKTVEKADKKRLYFTDGSSHFINQAQPLFFVVSDDGELINGSYMDGLAGREVVYIADNSLIYAIFYKE